MNRRIGIVVVGRGVAGRAWAAACAKTRGVRLLAVRRELDEALAESGADALLLATPHDLHAHAALRALDAGRHVLVEKPLDASPAAARALVARAEVSRQVTSVVSQFRFAPGVETLAKLVAQGRLGRVLTCTAELAVRRDAAYFAEAPWRADRARSGGGVLLMNGIHLLDVILDVLGPARVAGARLTGGRAVEDVASVLLSGARGWAGAVTVTSAAATNGSPRLTVVGTRGHVTLVDYRVRDGCLDGHRLRPGRGAGPEALLRRQLEDFASAVRESRPPRTTLAGGLAALELVSAAYQCAKGNA